mmetsp:Transcript_90933/g.246604  ORF Transcript_90933/g.246604 Transcript_90933/m.246604 type:complete len:276 (-) Transcript_90933:471-1298(-)
MEEKGGMATLGPPSMLMLADPLTRIFRRVSPSALSTSPGSTVDHSHPGQASRRRNSDWPNPCLWKSCANSKASPSLISFTARSSNAFATFTPHIPTHASSVTRAPASTPCWRACTCRMSPKESLKYCIATNTPETSKARSAVAKAPSRAPPSLHSASNARPAFFDTSASVAQASHTRCSVWPARATSAEAPRRSPSEPRATRASFSSSLGSSSIRDSCTISMELFGARSRCRCATSSCPSSRPKARVAAASSTTLMLLSPSRSNWSKACFKTTFI